MSTDNNNKNKHEKSLFIRIEESFDWNVVSIMGIWIFLFFSYFLIF